MARVRSVDGTRATPLSNGWRVAPAKAGQLQGPADLEAAALDWCPATAPGTVASALRAASRWDIDARVDFDASDWWWRCDFEAGPCEAPAARRLRFGGLASLAEVWLNGQSILRSEDMFLEHEVAVDGLLRDRNETVLCCRSITEALKARRPRPRWRTRLVDAQQLRWLRTTLVGRIPAWTPQAAPVGPWRPVWLEDRTLLASVQADVRARLEGDTGVVEVTFAIEPVGGRVPDRVVLRVGDVSSELAYHPGDAPRRTIARGSARIPGASRWWPHTHGPQPRYPAQAVVSLGAEEVVVDLGAVGFRHVEAVGGHGFGLRVNGVDVFARGACWTPLDVVSLGAAPEAYRSTLRAVRHAGMNMVRVSGPFFYEDDAFYEACDELGILVWQDYAFANMDYPGDDPGFVATVAREAAGFLDRTQTAASLAVLCGNGEVEQQAAMMGAPRDLWRSPLFSGTLAEASAAARPDVPYWPSTPSGGPLPFVSDAGTAHYFGVGGYLRPLEDARRANVRFATECLAFANVPDTAMIDALMKDGGLPPQHPRWKARTPRDAAAGWDFDDVRDHYLRALFGVDPLALRYSDVPRYLELSRVTTGEVMAATFAEWRREGSDCRGALVWFLRDLWPGAGWGLLDATGRPKAAYHYARRALQPTAVLLVDEGLNGLDAHAINEGPEPLDVDLRVALFRGEATVAEGKRALTVRARGAVRVRVAELLEHFIDATHAYRFGPPSHDVAVATLVDRSTGSVHGEAFHFPGGPPSAREADVGLEAVATPTEDGLWKLALRSRRLAQSVELEVRGYEPDDNYFHVAPGATRNVTLRAVGTATNRTGGEAPEGPSGTAASQPRSKPQGTARPLNAHATAKIVVSG